MSSLLWTDRWEIPADVYEGWTDAQMLRAVSLDG